MTKNSNGSRVPRPVKCASRNQDRPQQARRPVPKCVFGTEPAPEGGWRPGPRPSFAVRNFAPRPL
ncbi:hypothetical protein BOTBODRAFT_319637 [Botryobasidium botryosum FD-172 SS1]|uniref:Uncharacterized protein n=1 Tax=Botryobasidium botryosum (strain FD-172 SS1) TaxID=930990 RepID=A0A067MYP2_BOTB1|nr:hypothetical protein BOTBODRAFT_319637 [Botryobasidium botryosum FD-172 SS1]